MLQVVRSAGLFVYKLSKLQKNSKLIATHQGISFRQAQSQDPIFTLIEDLRQNYMLRF